MLTTTFLSFLLLASKVGTFWSGLMTVIFVFVAFLLIFLVTIQKGADSGGLGTAFGGGGSADSLFGVKTASGIKYVTAYLAVAFMILVLLIAKATTGSSIQDRSGSNPIKTQKSDKTDGAAPADDAPADDDQAADDHSGHNHAPDEHGTPADDDAAAPADDNAEAPADNAGEAPADDAGTPPADGGEEAPADASPDQGSGE